MSSSGTTDYYTSDQIKCLQVNVEQWLPLFNRMSPWMTAPPNHPGDAINLQYDAYHPFACNICKRGPLQKVQLLQCSGCKIVKYCCKDHQKLDWKRDHKQFCKLVSKLKHDSCQGQNEGQDQSSKRNNDSDIVVVKDKASWRKDCNYMRKYLQPITSIHTVAGTIYPMQPRCQSCYKAEADMPHNSPNKSKSVPPNELVPCPRCFGVSMCRSCLGDNHNNLTWKEFHPGTNDILECDHYLNNLLATGVTIDKGPLCLASKHNCSTLFRPRNWHEYLQKKRNDFSMSMVISMTPILHFITENLSFPLTIHHALSLDGVDRRVDKKKIIVHCVGAAATEEAAIRAFAEIARMDPVLQEVKIHLIGPQIGYADASNNGRVFPLNDFLSAEEGEELLNTSVATVQSWKGLYHDLEDELDEPDLYVAFNCGFSDENHLPYWIPTLHSIRMKNIPLVFTGYDFNEVRMDTQLLAERLQMTSIVHPSPNPFRSLRPCPDPTKTGDSPFYYQNASFSVVVGKV